MIADHVVPPQAGKIGVQAVTTSAGAKTDLSPSTEPFQGSVYVTFICDVAFYILFGKANTDAETPAPVVATTGEITTVTKDGRCMRVPADFPFQVEVSPEQRYFRVIGSNSGTLRYYISSPRG